MAAVRRLCASGIKPVRVVHGDGQVLSLVPPVKVADVVGCHPHHYVCHMSPELPSNRSAMLPLDYELEPGYVYFLLPVPRLFPTSSAIAAPCCCLSNHDTSSTTKHFAPRSGFSPAKLKQMVDRIGSPLRSAAKKKVSPELNKFSSVQGAKSDKYVNWVEGSPLLFPSYKSLKRSVSPRRNVSPKGSPNVLREGSLKRSISPKRSVSPKSSPNLLWESAKARSNNNNVCPREDLCWRWKPELGCISETDVFGAARNELHVCLDRRRLTFDCKVRSSSPLRWSRESRPMRDAYKNSPSKPGIALAAYVFV